ncbi:MULTISPECIES: ABC transporter ATP-binding protein [unclassified Paenibacillus]|uniref:ABC transporter ATP-binding protein n=1 Tax=unclassified Paenibacillus TaxID=185978 RepID=UPI001AEAA838|nr:putative spermidine/putrescine transport system ATP-binding protein [Paenibacillus sp. PvP091]MBP1169890.1 putative spermidine/putrescine transport system ATP-binding protein [Paenibacillus sp. PvR098]MBP2440918.1 putative spermidine/putrescine transport system ATP-binding protein [Paenibacillus sp. PvP052]
MSKIIELELIGIQKKFGSNVVVENFNLKVEQGECVSFLGPSGCGKTTTLNMIAGFLEPDQGELIIKGKKVNGVPSNKRELGMVFQTYSLFPHMNVFENVAYGLKLRKTPKSEIQDRVQKILELVKLPHVSDRYPKQLSGGQRQRIAIARALVTEPSLLLLDEPLSNLDAKLREELREELKRLQQEIGVTTVFVTHDQEEAMYLSNRIVVLDHGKVEQIGSPWDIYNLPASEFVHTFIGKSNRFVGTVVSASETEGIVLRTNDGLQLRAAFKGQTFKSGEAVSIYVRPEKITFTSTTGAQANDRNEAQGRIGQLSFLGSYAESEVQLGSTVINVRMPSDSQDRIWTAGETVNLQWKPEDVFVFPGKGNGANG